MSDIIQITYGELTTSFENEVMKAVQQVEINVNKEELLKALELADKLVRCKECKYWKSEHICIGRWGRYGTMMTEADAFCSYGERKEKQ